MRHIIIGTMALMALALPAHAQFRTLKDAQDDYTERKEIYEKQLEDSAKMQETAQESVVLLKGIALEMRKQTELLEAIRAEQKNQTAELSRQNELLKTH